MTVESTAVDNRNQAIRSLEPTRLWSHFADLNSVPRPSKKEERVIQFAKSFGESLGLETIVDGIGNVVIRKPASPAAETVPTCDALVSKIAHRL